MVAKQHLLQVARCIGTALRAQGDPHEVKSTQQVEGLRLLKVFFATKAQNHKRGKKI